MYERKLSLDSVLILWVSGNEPILIVNAVGVYEVGVMEAFNVLMSVSGSLPQLELILYEVI